MKTGTSTKRSSRPSFSSRCCQGWWTDRMKLFGPLYERTLALARHKHASTWLVVLSFFEAIIFPVMPEVMLLPMCVAAPRRGFWFASLSLAGSMVGAVVGYYLGHYAFAVIKPLFAALGMLH